MNAHLGTVRKWIQVNCFDGDRVEWGSQDILRFRHPVTVIELETLAEQIAEDIKKESEKH